MDFVPIVINNHWNDYHPTPILLDDSRVGPYNYPQDKPKSPNEVAQTKINSYASGVVSPPITSAKPTDGVFKKSLFWPIEAYEEGTLIPYVLAFGAFAMSPVIDPKLTYTSAALGAYAAGIIGNCVVLKARNKAVADALPKTH